jgi:multicomponent Na+:H+ antiporter subunit E
MRGKGDVDEPSDMRERGAMTGGTPVSGERPTRPGSRLLWAGQTFLVLMTVWLALNGLAAWWLGMLFAALGGVAGSTLAIGDPYPWRPLRLAAFFLYFLRVSLLGGIDVAGRALKPRLPIQPHFERYDLRVPEGQPRTLMLSLVSLVPGTLSANLEGDTLIAHVLAENASKTLRDLEEWVAWLFSLEDRI